MLNVSFTIEFHPQLPKLSSKVRSGLNLPGLSFGDRLELQRWSHHLLLILNVDITLMLKEVANSMVKLSTLGLSLSNIVT